MQSVAVFVGLLAAVSAASVQYVVPSTSSVVTSQRLGGNFAYTINQQPAVGYTGLYNGYVPTTAGLVAAKNGVVPAVSAYTVPAATYKTVAGVPTAYNGLGYYNGVYNGVYNPVTAYNGLAYNPVTAYNGLGYNGLAYNGLYNGVQQVVV